MGDAAKPKMTAADLRNRLAAAKARGSSGERIAKALRERKDTTKDMLATIEKAARTGRKVRVNYTKLTDGSEVYRVLEPYSFRYQGSTKGPGRWKFFFGHHGQHKSIEKYLFDNIHGVELTRNYFEPRWPVEIGQRIDKPLAMDELKRRIDAKPASALAHIDMKIAAEPHL